MQPSNIRTGSRRSASDRIRRLRRRERRIVQEADAPVCGAARRRSTQRRMKWMPDQKVPQPPLPAAMVIAHRLAHLYQAVACVDPNSTATSSPFARADKSRGRRSAGNRR